MIKQDYLERVSELLATPTDPVAQRFLDRANYQAFLLDFLTQIRAEERRVSREVQLFLEGRHPLQHPR
jgi:hypothetical protein